MPSTPHRANAPKRIDEHMQLSVVNVERASYSSLDIYLQQEHWIISHVLQGHVRTQTAGYAYTVGPGEVMIHPPHTFFSEYAEGPGVHEWIMFDAAIAPNIDVLRLHQIALVVPLTDCARFSSIFEQLLQQWHAADTPFRYLNAISSTLELLSIVLKSWSATGAVPRPTVGQSAKDRFTVVIQYMQENMSKKISRPHLAEMVHLHPGYFDRLFTKTYRMTPMQMLTSLRLRKAKELLQDSDYTLNHIAHTCGFTDASYLHRVFHRHFELTPGQYRNQVKLDKQSYLSNHGNEQS